jgi:phage shock protein E
MQNVMRSSEKLTELCRDVVGRQDDSCLNPKAPATKRHQKQKSNMLKQIKNLLGFGPAIDYAKLIKQGAVIVDVRSKGEYAAGHIKGSINISVDSLSQSLDRIRALHKPIITCCASGVRSSRAKTLLESNHFKEVYDGGSWSQLQNKIK